MTVDDRYYTPTQAAEVLGCDDDKVLSWIHSGELIASNVAGVKNGKRPRWRIAASDLGKFLMSRRHAASLATPPQPKRTRIGGTSQKFFG